MEIITRIKHVLDLDNGDVIVKRMLTVKDGEVNATSPVPILTPLELQDELASQLLNPIEDDSIEIIPGKSQFRVISVPDGYTNKQGFTCSDCGSTKIRTVIIHANDSKVFLCKRHSN